MDQRAVLYHLPKKHSSPSKEALYVAFIDLRMAFDPIPHQRLWRKLAATSIDCHLLWLIILLHQSTTVPTKKSEVTVMAIQPFPFLS